MEQRRPSDYNPGFGSLAGGLVALLMVIAFTMQVVRFATAPAIAPPDPSGYALDPANVTGLRGIAFTFAGITAFVFVLAGFDLKVRLTGIFVALAGLISTAITYGFIPSASTASQSAVRAAGVILDLVAALEALSLLGLVILRARYKRAAAIGAQVLYDEQAKLLRAAQARDQWRAKEAVRKAQGQEPAPRLLRTTRDAEFVAAEWMRYYGFRDAEVTQATRDEGIDVVASQAVAQVKMQAIPVGRPQVQQLFGCAQAARASALFFALGGYTADAQQWADRVGVALFSFDFQGAPVAINPAAHDIVKGEGSR
ncbi:MAG TPA: restriction endonuclease [Acidimicrobiales bacterium]|nr:restriction endonuclease [Acidimicrobiales bacterium]